MSPQLRFEESRRMSTSIISTMTDVVGQVGEQDTGDEMHEQVDDRTDNVNDKKAVGAEGFETELFANAMQEVLTIPLFDDPAQDENEEEEDIYD